MWRRVELSFRSSAPPVALGAALTSFNLSWETKCRERSGYARNAENQNSGQDRIKLCCWKVFRFSDLSRLFLNKSRRKTSRTIPFELFEVIWVFQDSWHCKFILVVQARLGLIRKNALRNSAIGYTELRKITRTRKYIQQLGPSILVLKSFSSFNRIETEECGRLQGPL